MLLASLALTACGQSNVPEQATVTKISGSTIVATSTVTQATTETQTEKTTVEPADAAATQSVFTLGDVRFPSEGNPELVIQDVRAGSHDGFDRVVFEYAGPGKPGIVAGYNPEPRQQASGYPLDVPGNAYLELMIQGTPMMMMSPREDLIPPGPVGVAAGGVTSVVHGGVFEANTQYVIGLDRQRPYQVYLMDNPTRVVVEFEQ